MTPCPCICHSNGAFPPPCPTPGGCGPHETAEGAHRCQRGSRCFAYERVETDGQQQKLGAVCDRPLCDTCERAVAQALEEVPKLYVDLRNATLVQTAGVRSEFVSRSAGHPLPGNGAARHLAEQVHWLLTTWEDEVRSIASLAYPEREGKRQGRQVAEAAELLSNHLTAWISAPTATINTQSGNHDPDKRRAEPRPTEDVSVDQSGAEAAAALIDWRGQARNLPGIDTQAPKAVRRYDERCPACGVRAITHRAGDDLMQCQSCGATQEYRPTLPKDADYREGSAA